MVSKLKELLEKIKKSQEFKDFVNGYPQSYLVSAFFMAPPQAEVKWALDFYDPKEHKITTFIDDNKIKVYPSQQIMQKERKEVPKLDLGEVKISFEEARKIADELQKEKYPGEEANKFMVVLQVIDDNITWNISYLTYSFKLLNIKVNAINGKITENSVENLLKTKLTEA